MRGVFLRNLALSLICLAVMLTGVSCASKETEPALLQCNGVDITESVYRMYLYEAGVELRDQYLPTYTDAEFSALPLEEMDDYYRMLDAFWITEIDGRMPFEIVRENALESLKIYAYYSKACSDNNVAMTKEEMQSFTSMMELYYQDDWDEIESLFGVTKEQYISYLAQMDTFASFVDIQASGIAVSSAELASMLDRNRQEYAKVVVQTVFLAVTEEKGAETQKALAEEIKSKIEAGEDFTELVANYSDYQEYEDGSFVVTGESAIDKNLGKGFVSYVLETNKDDIYIVETDKGYCVTQTVNVGQNDDAAGALSTMVQDEKYTNRVKSIIQSSDDYEIIIVDQERYDAISDVPEILK